MRRIERIDRLMCGGTARFEANAKNVDFSFWQFTWQKRTGNSKECFDTNQEKYKGSSNNILLIQNVSKEDEGEYQAVISREANGVMYRISSNTVYLHTLGGINKEHIYMPERITAHITSSCYFICLLQSGRF